MKKILLSVLFLSCVFPILARDRVRDSLDFSRAVSVSAADMIQGRVSGVKISLSDGNPCGEQDVVIRGVNSLRTGSRPLWIVDGAILGEVLNLSSEAFWQYGDYARPSALNSLAFLSAYDIESIEVLKNASETALYGADGSDGVILVRTRRPGDGNWNVDWHSNFSVDIPPYGNAAMASSFSHNHHFALSGTRRNTSYNFSLWYRAFNPSLKNTLSRYGGVKADLETGDGKMFDFGFHTVMSVGKASAMTGNPASEVESGLLAMRGLGQTSVEGWLMDFDDDASDWRTVVSTWFRVKLMKNLHWKTSLGVDFQNVSRIQWYGNATKFGVDHNGAASVSDSKLLNVNAMTELSYNRYFGSNHHLSAFASVGYVGGINRYGTMTGENFATHQLRGKGLGMMESERHIRRFHNVMNRLFVSASVDYDWNSAAGLSLSWRGDRIYRYSGAMNSYPAASLWLDLHNLLFRQGRTVSGLRLEGGYGVSGKFRQFPYQHLGYFLKDGLPDVEAGSEEYFEGFESLRTSEWHAGLSAGFLSERIRLSFSYYDKKSRDDFKVLSFGEKSESGLWNYSHRSEVCSLPASSGNRGIELDLNANLVSTASLTWNLDFAMSSNRLDLGEDCGIPSLQGRYSDYVFGAGTALSYKGLDFETRLDAVRGNALCPSFFRWSRLSVGYQIPVGLKWMKALCVSLTGTDLATSFPERGFPFTRSVLLGLSLKF